jgi:quercetin dioxygenase-like cupin family protein
MLTARTQDLELNEVWIASDSENARVRPAFPINKHTGAAGSGVVYFELEPGKRLARHTDSAEEILYIVAGTAEAEVGGEHGNVSAGDLAVIPAMVPHALRNLGDDTVKVVGFFADATIVSEFEEPLMPMGVTQMEQGAPAPVAAA